MSLQRAPGGASPRSQRWSAAARAAGARWPLPELALAAALAAILFLPSLRNALPVGYGAYWFLMAERVIEEGFALPHTVPFYGPGGTPFAYPPLGIYATALATGPLGVPLHVYLRLFPPTCMLVVTLAIYLLARRLTASRWAAMAAAAMATTTPVVVAYHNTATGTIRGPALAFAIGTVLLAARALAGDRRQLAATAGAAALLASTTLSHLSYAVFAALGVLALAAFHERGERRRWGRRAAIVGVIGLGGALLSAPWWVTVISRHGLATLLGPASSHGSFGLANLGGQESSAVLLLVDLLARLARADFAGLAAGVAVAGLGRLAATGRLLLPAWFAANLFFLGESDRFLVVIGAIAAGDLLAHLAEDARTSEATPARRLCGALPGLLVVGLCLLAALVAQYRQRPSLTPEFLATGEWMRTDTPPDSRYLELTGNHDLGEWLPYLSRRTPVLGHWGAEWTGAYSRQSLLHDKAERCARQQDAECVLSLASSLEAPADLLVVPTRSATLHDHLVATGAWHEEHRNAEFSVLARTALDAPVPARPAS